MKFISILLKEGRKEDLMKKYSDKFHYDDLEFILNISDLVDFNHKYTDFVLKNLRPDSQNLEEDVQTAIEVIKDFDKYQSKLTKRDINQYKSIQELDDALELVIQAEKEKQEEREAERNVDKIYEDDKFLVVKPKTEAASCRYGSNTKWCVTSKGSGHFGRYTSGSQGLYFIINKANSTDKNYSKVAVHFDAGGNAKYWDSQDLPIDAGRIEVLNYAFPEIFQSINDNYKETSQSAQDIFLKEVFNSSGTSVQKERNFLGGPSSLNVGVKGFSTINDLGPGHAEGNLDIVYNIDLIDSYHIFITYKPINSQFFSASIGFMGKDLDENTNYMDLELEGWGFDAKYMTQGKTQYISESIRNHIANRVLDYIKEKPQLQQKVIGSAKVWKPNRMNYGYTFGKGNKGLIGKLIKYLDDGYDNGTKLDFLEYIGKIKSRQTNGKKEYAHINSNSFSPSSNWRGHFSSFFASAKNAGIIKYVKDGKRFIMKMGPNFEDFKTGKLKAL